MKTLYTLFFCLLLSVGCDDGEEDSSTTPPASSSSCTRVGATCKDGSTSTATGSGACSHHGGVASWICK